jgi:tRNA A-37 threonylcarbamoyl transferase component Bud32
MNGSAWIMIVGIGLVLLLGLVGYVCNLPRRRRVRLQIHPVYQEFLEQCGLADVDRLLALPLVIVSGHPDRHVGQVNVGLGSEAVRAYLKRQHRVSRKERLLNAWAGFGLVSKSVREFRVLTLLRAAGVSCPEPIAAGEDQHGRAFLLVRELNGPLDLRVHLARIKGQSPGRRKLARRLGETLAQIHDAGFDHPDLYAKHLRVHPRTGGVYFLDWQRTCQRRLVSWARRWRDLAALHASVADHLASPLERLVVFRAYLRATAQTRVPRAFWLGALTHIRGLTHRLRQKRRIREQHQAPLATGMQNLIWLEGESLCLTREFLEEIQRWGERAAQALLARLRSRENCEPSAVQRSTMALGQTRQGLLVVRRARQPLRWLAALVRGQRLASPELEQAVTMFRLQRFGVGTPRLLAVGHRHARPWSTESFLLTETPAGTMPLAEWLADQAGQGLWTGERKQRRQWIAEAGRLLRRLHDAGYWCRKPGRQHFLIQSGGLLVQDAAPRAGLILGSLDGIIPGRCARAGLLLRELDALNAAFSDVLDSQTDKLRFFREYLGVDRLTAQAKRLIRGIKFPGQPKTAAATVPERLPLPLTTASPRAA